jgi:addiction module HigA family antidote
MEDVMSITIDDVAGMDFSDVAEAGKLKPIHAGEILREEFMKPMGLSASAVAVALHVPAPRINDIVLERRGISADTAVRLARFFGMPADFWMGLQADYDRRMAENKLAVMLPQIRRYQAVA